MNIQMHTKKNIQTKLGFTVLFAVLVSSLVLALGLGIVAITMKEVQLSGTGRDSQLAFYAADSGVECAYYWDSSGIDFATSSESTVSASDLSDYTCARNSLNKGEDGLESAVVSKNDQHNATTTFWVFVAQNGGQPDITKPCAKVDVAKIGNPNDREAEIITVIDSRGYNTCDTSNARRLERGYQINY